MTVQGSDVRSRKRERTRAEILDTAWGLVRRGGIGSLSLRELAANIGMTAPALYTYFPSKNDIYDAMYAQGMQQFARQLETSPLGRNPLVALRNRARTFVTAAVEDPIRFELLFQRPIPGFVPSPESLAIGLVGLAATRKVAEAAGLRREPEFDLFMATVRGLVELQIANDPGGNRWIGLVDEAVNVLVAHYAKTPPKGSRATPRR